MATPQLPAVQQPLTPAEPFRYYGLRTKFVAFFSVILILSCSALSWHFIENRRDTTRLALKETGLILLTNLVSNQHFRYAGLIAEDRGTLEEFLGGLMAVDDVTYAVITKPDGTILAKRAKGPRESFDSLARTTTNFLYPDPRIAESVIRTAQVSPLVTTTPIVTNISSRFSWEEHLYDFALAVPKTAGLGAWLESLSLQKEESGLTDAHTKSSEIAAVVQIGLSDARLAQELTKTVTHALFITMFVIGAGIFGAHLLTRRITTPLRKLATVTHQLTAGEIPSTIPSAASDEIGELTRMFNRMARSIQERNAAIHVNMETIKRQIAQLNTVHETSAAITKTLDLQQLLNTILRLLMSNMGFTRMVLMLRHEDKNVAYVGQIEGVSDEVAEAASFLSIPIEDDDTILSELFINARSLLVRDIQEVAHRMHPSIVELARRENVHSFVCVPLTTPKYVLGFIAGDRSPHSCSEDDLHILTTIAGHVATAIDNARAYHDLSQLTQSLEYRIEQRTEELTAANELLKEHDSKRSAFFSVASHELRTPMTAIRSFADNMLDGVAGPLTDQQKMYLNRMGHNLNRLTRIINQLLDWSRLDLKKETLRLESVCVGQIAGMVAETLRTVANEKQVALDVVIPDTLPAVEADRDKLEQIFWNLIGNAVKFTPRDGKITVELSVTPDDHVQVRISDTGCGIAPEHLDKIFNEFSKVPSPVPHSQGAQLGLFITKALINMHQGSLTVESALNVGTTFTITLPCKQGHHEKATGILISDARPGNTANG